MISQPRSVPERQLRGISTEFSLSPELSASDNWEAPRHESTGRNYEVVENGEIEEWEKVHKASQISTKWWELCIPIPFSSPLTLLFQKTKLWVDGSTSSPTAPLYMVPSRNSRVMTFGKMSKVWKLTFPSYCFPLVSLFLLFHFSYYHFLFLLLGFSFLISEHDIYASSILPM